MSDNKLQKKSNESLKEKGQYALAFGVIATMLMVAGFPMFVIFFFGIFAYFLWKTFSSPSPSETRRIFEFYLSANEILRDDERRWFGFEVQEVLVRGEKILQSIGGAPPLVHFTLGALYNKIGDYKSAVNHLSYVVENENSDESTYLYPTPELREYAKTLRKIEREPAEAPQTSAAVRALERARRNRGKTLLEESRKLFDASEQAKRDQITEQKIKRSELSSHENLENQPSVFKSITEEDVPETIAPKEASKNEFSQNRNQTENQNSFDRLINDRRKTKKSKKDDDPFANHKPITEVLHDIYDKNIQ
ncbi:MAG: hypothetical protein ABIP06_12685 [Pyrinomonadaceae bacterium]